MASGTASVVKRPPAWRRIIALCLLTITSTAVSAQLPLEPMLRVDTGGVVAMQRAAVHDERAGIAYTAGDDKAIRLWRTSDLRLIDTWYLPAATGPEGQVNALALSADGRWLAAGGWTGRTWDKSMSVYIFDTATGQIHKRLTGIGPAIGTLRFSPDGKYFAVGLIGPRAGVLLLRFDDLSLLLHDADYQDSALGLDMSDREMAVASLDGALRRYDYRAARLLQTQVLREGRHPVRVAYSPSGDALAVGFHDAARPAVYSAADLSLTWWPSAQGTKGQLNLSAVAWSPLGDRLFAAGDPAALGVSHLFHWPTGSSAAPVREQAALQRVASLTALADGSLLVLAEDPLVARRLSDGRWLKAADSGTLDYRPAARQFDISRDGTVVHLAAQREALTDVLIDMKRLDVELRPFEPGAWTARPAARPLRLTWQPGKASATLGGRRLELKDYEFVHAAASTTTGHTVLGTEFGVRAYRADGTPLWFTGLEGVVRALRSSEDGRFIVVASSDGTVRWLEAAAGEVQMSVYIHGGTGEWVAWNRSGFYASSPRGDDLIGWQLNRSARERARFYRASQFERALYRPDLVKAALVPSKQVPEESIEFNAKALAAISPPEVTIESVQDTTSTGRGGALRVKVRALRTSSPMRSVSVFIDDVPVTRFSERQVKPGEADAFVREFVVPSHQKADTLRIEVAGDHSIGVREMALAVQPERPDTPRRPRNLYVLAIGVQRFPLLPARFELEFSERDAQEIAKSFQQQEGVLFDRVRVRVIDGSAKAATTARVLEALPFVEQAGPDDTVVLFLASHGVRDGQGNYFFATSDTTQSDLCTVLDGTPDRPEFCVGMARSERHSLIDWRAFHDALARSAGHRVLIVDTCEAAGIAGNSEPGSLRKRSASSRFALLLAAGNGEYSQEYRAGRHGLFTYALLKSLAGGVDPDGNGLTSLDEAFQSTTAEVTRLRDRRLTMTPVLDAPVAQRKLPMAVASKPGQAPSKTPSDTPR